MVAINLVLLSSINAQIKTSDTYKQAGYVVKVEKEELTKITNDCDAVANKVILIIGGRTIYTEAICTADIEDVRFTNKGYLTVVEHYSSPVGWTIYYIFDLCKNQLIKTKRIDEGIELDWSDFIEPTQVTREKYIEKVTNLN